jgi:hypothetical protein
MSDYDLNIADNEINSEEAPETNDLLIKTLISAKMSGVIESFTDHDGIITIKNIDGSETFIDSDGTIFTLETDGTLTETVANGIMLFYSTDGTFVKGFMPNGENFTINYLQDGVISALDADGTQYILNTNGSITTIKENGSIYTEDYIVDNSIELNSISEHLISPTARAENTDLAVELSGKHIDN